jgi:hypothetical protein
MTLPRSAELHCQKEIIEVWLNTADLPPDARTSLLEMPQSVNEEMNALHLDGRTN